MINPLELPINDEARNDEHIRDERTVEFFSPSPVLIQ